MKLIHLDPAGFSRLVQQGVTVVGAHMEIAKDEIVLFVAPEDYPKYPFHVVIAARFRDWMPLRPIAGEAAQVWALFPNAWWILNKPFLMQDVAMSGRRYHTGAPIVEVHEADEVIIRQRGIQETGPLQNPGPREPPLRTVDDERIMVLFHDLWGRDKSHPEYNKAEWSELQRLLRDRGVRF
ncbi:MAG TPA: hypothetical protein VK012_04495 [Gemmatimonadales bacterium]|nr:hypothetical protein [Gemmatimonadales bacterium]